jgi:hypothetical protein
MIRREGGGVGAHRKHIINIVTFKKPGEMNCECLTDRPSLTVIKSIKSKQFFFSFH